jgi:hypothetical protein
MNNGNCQAGATATCEICFQVSGRRKFRIQIAVTPMQVASKRRKPGSIGVMLSGRSGIKIVKIATATLARTHKPIGVGLDLDRAANGAGGDENICWCRSGQADLGDRGRQSVKTIEAASDGTSLGRSFKACQIVLPAGRGVYAPSHKGHTCQEARPLSSS